ncbi:integral membrane protein [Ceratocystis lukuohia]|uniref:Integral membrane protein n=1 Tax=Ceratocystis lukuohia TaxID=2019550 RepID=A0ABR4MLR3_9PEZI
MVSLTSSPRVLCKLILGFLVLTHLWIVVSIFTTCVPLSSLWDVSPFGVKAGVYCHPKAVFWLNYGLHVGTDFLIFALPIPLMFYVAVPLVQHIALFAMPMAGFAICAISAVRTATLVSNIHLDDITYTTVSYVNLTMIEIGLTISWASLLAMHYIYDPLSETQDQSPAIDAAFMREQLDIFPHNLSTSTQNVPGEHKIPLDLQPLPPALHRSLQSQETMVWGEDITEYTRRHHHRLHLDSVSSPYYHQSLHGLRLTESQVAITQVQSRPQSSQSRAHSRAHSREDSLPQSQPQTRRNSDMSGFLPIFAPADTADDDAIPGRGSQDKDGRRLSYKILNIQRSTTPSSISLRFATAPKTKPTRKWRRSHVQVDDDEGNEEWGPHPGERRSLTSPMFVPPSQ